MHSIPCKVLHEAKSTRGLLKLVETHHYPLDVAGTSEELVQLLLSSEKREISHIHGGAVPETSLLISS